MRTAFCALALVVLAALPARAQEDEAARAERWRVLSQTVFGDRKVEDGAGIIQLDAPSRALDAALVPIGVTITGDRPIQALYILIDGNPSPLAGTFHFGPAADPHSLKLRVRVDQYTLMHAVAETADGHLYVAESFVKAAGGCSAPATEDAALALTRLGQMKLRSQGGVTPGRPATAELLISHPNANGMQMDQVTRNYTPARFIQTVQVTYGGTKVFDLDADISLSEDPAITFGFLPNGPGPLDVRVEDSRQTVWTHSFTVPPQAS